MTFNKKSILKCLTADFGAILLVTIYVVCGTYLFQFTEIYTERQMCETGEFLEKKIMNKYSQLMINYLAFNYKNEELDSILAYDDATKTESKLVKLNELKPTEVNELLVTNILYKIRNLALANQQSYRYFGQNCSALTVWSFPSALLFTLTLVTTIGYGHITPASLDGKIICICYSLIGIPLFLIGLSRFVSIIIFIIGKMFDYSTNSAEIRFARLRAMYTTGKKIKSTEKKIPGSLMLSILIAYILLGGYLFTNEGKITESLTMESSILLI